MVSIHAPVMDANPEGKDYTDQLNVSIHAPVMDAKETRCKHIHT